MKRFFCPSLIPGDKVAVIDDPQEVHHMMRVLRLEAGETVELLNGQGLIARARMEPPGKRSVGFVIETREQVPCSPAPRCVIACAIPKHSKFETIVEKCVELGVDEIVPIVTARTIFTAKRDKTDRFRDVMVSACKQSRRAWFPALQPVMSFEQAAAALIKEGHRLYIPWLEGERTLLRTAVECHVPSGTSVTARVFFIGPEGDFTPAEAQQLISKGAVPVSLGDIVLRVETAAIAVSAYMHFNYPS